MDPRRALLDALDDLASLSSGGIEGVKDSDLRGTCATNLEALAMWIRKGGFAPKVVVDTNGWWKV